MKKLYLTAVLLILALAFAGWIFWRYFYLASVTIDPIPSGATVTVNGRAMADRTLHLAAGSYKIIVTAPGYRDQELSINAGVGSQITKRVTLVALPSPKKLITAPINSLVVSQDKTLVYYESAGTLYRVKLTSPTPAEAITPQLKDVRIVEWAPDLSLALIHKTSGEVTLYDFARYDLLHQEERSLGNTFGATAWATDSSAFFYDSKLPTGQRLMVKANRAGKNQTNLGDLSSLPTTLNFLAGPNNLIIMSQADLKGPGDIILFDTYQRLIIPITDSAHAYGPVLSPSKQKITYLDNGELVVADTAGTNKRNLNIRPKLGNYLFLDDNTLAIFQANKITTIKTDGPGQQDFAVAAQNETIANLFADEGGKKIYYTYQNALYRLDFRQ